MEVGFNNLNIISILNGRYAEYFGFSDNEVQESSKYYALAGSLLCRLNRKK